MRGTAVTRRVAAVARAQHGNVDFAQLRDAGLTAAEVQRRVETGWLFPRHTRVFAVGHVPRSRASKWHAAVLALGPEARLSYEAAAAQIQAEAGDPTPTV